MATALTVRTAARVDEIEQTKDAMRDRPGGVNMEQSVQAGPESDDRKVRFRLHVAGNLPNSRRAIANLRDFCNEHLPEQHEIEILDVFEAPERALEDKISLTPHLLAETSNGVWRMTGDLSDRESLVNAASKR